MKALVQRVSEACVTVNGDTVSSIGQGIVLFLGIEKGDEVRDIHYLVKKVTNLRFFGDSHGKMNLSVRDVRGSILVISQFTLAAECRKGNRPSFDNAEAPGVAEKLYHIFVQHLGNSGIIVATGRFGAHMRVRLVNDGPVTFLIDSRK